MTNVIVKHRSCRGREPLHITAPGTPLFIIIILWKPQIARSRYFIQFSPIDDQRMWSHLFYLTARMRWRFLSHLSRECTHFSLNSIPFSVPPVFMYLSVSVILFFSVSPLYHFSFFSFPSFIAMEPSNADGKTAEGPCDLRPDPPFSGINCFSPLGGYLRSRCFIERPIVANEWRSTKPQLTW